MNGMPEVKRPVGPSISRDDGNPPNLPRSHRPPARGVKMATAIGKFRLEAPYGPTAACFEVRRPHRRAQTHLACVPRSQGPTCRS